MFKYDWRMTSGTSFCTYGYDNMATERKFILNIKASRLQFLQESLLYVRNIALHRGLRVPFQEGFVRSLVTNLPATNEKSSFLHNRQLESTAVSYTHLDVYKRQVWYNYCTSSDAYYLLICVLCEVGKHVCN